jgi:hypothetical protein
MNKYNHNQLISSEHDNRYFVSQHEKMPKCTYDHARCLSTGLLKHKKGKIAHLDHTNIVHYEITYESFFEQTYADQSEQKLLVVHGISGQETSSF